AIESAKVDLVHREKTLSSRQKAINEFVARIRQYENEKQIRNERLKYLNDRAISLREQIEQDRKSNERARFSIQSLEAEKETALVILKEIEEKRDLLQQEYEDQKGKTQQLQQEADGFRQMQRDHQEESYQLNKAVEIREIQISSLKQEMEKTVTDSSERRSEEHTSELQSRENLVCRLLLE